MKNKKLIVDLMEHMNYLKNCDNIPTSKEEIFELSYMDFKMLMSLNASFYNAAIVLLDEEIKEFIEMLSKGTTSRTLKNVKTLDDLLNTKYFGQSAEDRRDEFVTVFSEYLCRYLAI